MACPNPLLCWYDTIDVGLLGIGFTPTWSDPCVYTHESDDTFTILTLYIDGILISGRNLGVVKGLKKALMDRFATTDMGEVSLVLSMDVTRNYGDGLLRKNMTFIIIWRGTGCWTATPFTRRDVGHKFPSNNPRISYSEDKLLGAQGVDFYQTVVGSVI